jgi:hypothetical protein
VTFRFDMSAGEFFDLIRPAAILIAALVSTWVLTSARKRFSLLIAFACAIGTLFLPLIVFPLYLVTLLFFRKRNDSNLRGRFKLPLLYAAVVLTFISIYFYRDYESADAHLARATQARLIYDRQKTISELQKALAVDDDPHTHKLLAVEFAEAGYWSDAISEYRLAEKGGEPDDSIHLQLGMLLEKINQTGQAQLEYHEFLSSTTCSVPNNVCDAARNRLEQLRSQ